MNAGQKARRWLYRARRRFIGGADHDAIVEVEGRRPAVSARAKRAAGRWLRAAAGFAATFAALGLVYGASLTWRERVSLPLDPAETAGPPAGSRAIAAAAGLLSLESLDSERAAWFAPRPRKQRLAAFQAGAADAVAAFVEVVERRRAGRDKDLAAAAAALSADDPDAPAIRYAAARDALRRFNARAGRNGPPVDRGQGALAALARAAAASAQAHDHALRVGAGRLHPGAIVGPSRVEFYRARGQAYAWRLLLKAYDEEMPARTRAATAAPMLQSRAALAEAATFEPLFFASPLFGGNNPLLMLARRVAAAKPPLDALADKAEGPPS